MKKKITLEIPKKKCTEIDKNLVYFYLSFWKLNTNFSKFLYLENILFVVYDSSL